MKGKGLCSFSQSLFLSCTRSRELELFAIFLTKKGSKAQVEVVEKAVYRGEGYRMEILCVYKFTGQPRNVDMLNKLFDIPNNRSARKEQEMYLKRKATVEGSRNKKAK